MPTRPLEGKGPGPEEIANVFIPDLPQVLGDGTAFEVSHFLAEAAAEIFLAQPERERGLVVVGESVTRPRRPNEPNHTAWHTLVRQGVPEKAIKTTATGVDPVTNFIRAGALFETNAPVGIVTPAVLWAVHRRIAERTMTRSYGGFLVEGLSGERTMARELDVLLSRRVSVGQSPRRLDLARAERRTIRARRLAKVLPGSGGFYDS